MSPGTWDRNLKLLKSTIPEPLVRNISGDRIHKMSELLGAESGESLYHGLISQWTQPQTVVIGGSEPKSASTDQSTWPELPGLFRRMMYIDLVSYLPDDILAKVDRASMATSLEARVPLLDHRIVEFAASLPLELSVQQGQGKGLLRRVLYQYVPQGLVERPKMGFGVPIDAWLRGPLEEWATDLLDEQRMRTDGYFRPESIQQKWREHLEGSRNWQYQLWTVLQFQAWLNSIEARGQAH